MPPEINYMSLALPGLEALGFAMYLRIQTVDQHLEAILGLNAVQEHVPEQVSEHMRQFMEDITSQVRQLTLENQFLKQRVISLENTVHDQSQHIYSLENTLREQNIALHDRIARLEMKFEAFAEPRREEYRSLATQKKQLRDGAYSNLLEYGKLKVQNAIAIVKEV